MHISAWEIQDDKSTEETGNWHGVGKGLEEQCPQGVRPKGWQGFKMSSSQGQGYVWEGKGREDRWLKNIINEDQG